MGQYEILEFLDENAEGWFTARQIAEQTDQSFGSVLKSVKKLRKSGIVEFRKIGGQSVSRKCFRGVHAYRGKTGSLPLFSSGLQGKT